MARRGSEWVQSTVNYDENENANPAWKFGAFLLDLAKVCFNLAGARQNGHDTKFISISTLNEVTTENQKESWDF